MSDGATKLLAQIPKWLFSASFTVIVIILIYLLFTGTKLVLDGGIEFQEKNLVSAFSESEDILIDRVFEAKSDGLIVITVIGTRAGEGVGGLEVIAGPDQNPSTRLCAATLSGHPQAQWIANQRSSCTTPIRIGEFYTVKRTGNLDTRDYTYDMRFIPLK